MPKQRVPADRAFDYLTRHSINVHRYEAGVQKKILANLKELEDELVATLAKMDPTAVSAVSYRKIRMLKLLEQTRENIRRTYAAINKETQAAFKGLALLEDRAVGNAIDVALLADVTTVAMPASTAAQLAKNTLIEGAPIKDWWAKQAGNLQERFKQEMAKGMAQGENLGDLTKRIRGTREAGYQNGIMSKSRREAEALVRTSSQAVQNESRMEAYKANSDIISGVEAVVTFDLRTTDLCIGRSGAIWDLETGKATKESPVQEDFPGPPPWHWNCRTALVPVLYSWDKITNGKIKEKIPEGTRATMNGQAPTNLTYEQWLKQRSPKEQDRILGKGKAQLWREGKITLRDLVDQSGRPISLQKLQEAVDKGTLPGRVAPKKGEPAAKKTTSKVDFEELRKLDDSAKMNAIAAILQISQPKGLMEALREEFQTYGGQGALDWLENVSTYSGTDLKELREAALKQFTDNTIRTKFIPIGKTIQMPNRVDPENGWVSALETIGKGRDRKGVLDALKKAATLSSEEKIKGIQDYYMKANKGNKYATFMPTVEQLKEMERIHPETIDRMWALANGISTKKLAFLPETRIGSWLQNEGLTGYERIIPEAWKYIDRSQPVSQIKRMNLSSAALYDSLSSAAKKGGDPTVRLDDNIRKMALRCNELKLDSRLILGVNDELTIRMERGQEVIDWAAAHYNIQNKEIVFTSKWASANDVLFHEWGHSVEYLFAQGGRDRYKEVKIVSPKTGDVHSAWFDKQKARNEKIKAMEEFKKCRAIFEKKTGWKKPDWSYEGYKAGSKLQDPAFLRSLPEGRAYCLYSSNEWWAESICQYTRGGSAKDKLERDWPLTYKWVHEMLTGAYFND